MEKPSERYRLTMDELHNSSKEWSAAWSDGVLLSIIDQLWEEVERMKRERAENP